MSEESPTRLDRLRSHVEALEVELAGANGSAFAALSGRYLEALRELDELEGRAPVAKSKVDELAERRKSRRRPIKNGEARETS